jgi:hypothetical protein
MRLGHSNLSMPRHVSRGGGRNQFILDSVKRTGKDMPSKLPKQVVTGYLGLDY